MVKIKKTYRLNDVTVERIQIMKKHYEEKGFELSDAQVIERAISLLMDIPFKGLDKDDFQR